MDSCGIRILLHRQKDSQPHCSDSERRLTDGQSSATVVCLEGLSSKREGNFEYKEGEEEEE